jgi:hypothetical protein
MSEGPYLRTYLWLLLTVCCSFTIAACNNPSSSDNAAKKAEAPASSPGPTSNQSPPSPATTASTQLTSTPKIDPNAPIPALSTDMIEAFSKEIPELAQERDVILNAERDAIKGAIEDARSKLSTPTPAGKKTSSLIPAIGPLAVLRGPVQASRADSFSLVAAAEAADPPSLSVLGDLQFAVIGQNLGMFLGGANTNADTSSRGGSRTVPFERNGRVVAEIKQTKEPGQPSVAELTTQIAHPILGVDAFSKFTISGSFCPAPDGSVSITVTYSSTGRAGKNKTMTYGKHYAAVVKAVVGEDAEVSKQDYQLTPADGPDSARSKMLGEGALNAARMHWEKGNCIKIIATSPGNVAPKATSTIPVDVIHRWDGSKVPAKVTIELSGGASISPAVIPRTPGEVTHVAVDEKDATMKVTLTATSRRGKATEPLTITTGTQVYLIEGGADEFHATGVACNFAKPFIISTDNDNGIVTVTFTPTSATGGTYSYSGKLKGFMAWGKGIYTVTYQGDIPVHITARGPGTVKTPMGDMTAEGTEEYTITPYSSNSNNCN